MLIRQFLQKTGARAWLAGGTVRDLLMGRQPYDLDLVTEGDPEPLARRFADETSGSYFALSEEFRTARVISAGRAHSFDFSACRGGSIEADLKFRDFTINAMAVELPEGRTVIDPLGGRDDLEAGRIAAAGPDIFDHDPLRLLRAVRLEKVTGLAVAQALVELIRQKASLAARPAAERTFSELVRLFEAPGAAAQVRRLDELGLLEVLLPEMIALKGVGQNDYHHLDVYEHTLANCEALDRVIESPADFFPEQAEKIAERSRRRIAGDTTWRFVMSFSSLMHDIAKPTCRFIDVDSQVRFFEHDRLGAEMTAAIMGRFKASAEATRTVSFLVKKHLRFEGLLQQPAPSDRARLRYLKATEPLSPEEIMLSVSDRLSVRGRLVTEEGVKRHLALAREMMAAAFAAEEAEPLPRLIDGDDLMRQFGLQPGPVIGRLLNHIDEEQRLGRLSSWDEALAEARRFLEEAIPGRGYPSDEES